MTTEKVDFSDVRATMLMTLHLRALDADSANPVLADRYAADAVRRIDHDWQRLNGPGVHNRSYAVAMRGRIFDQLAADFLSRHPTATVLNLACGLDSRVFRLAPPEDVRWFDVDLPEVIELRRELYAESDGYRMMAASVTESDWLDELPRDRPVLVLVEGLLMYLPQVRIWHLLSRLTAHFPTGEIVFDGVQLWVTVLTQVLRGYFHRWYHQPAYLTSHRHYPGIIADTPGLREISSSGVITDPDRAPVAATRRYYRALNHFFAVEDWVRVHHTAF